MVIKLTKTLSFKGFLGFTCRVNLWYKSYLISYFDQLFWIHAVTSFNQQNNNTDGCQWRNQNPVEEGT